MVPTSRNKKAAVLFGECSWLWRHYGGWREFLRSPYLWSGFALALLLSLRSGCGWFWYESALGVLPNLLGFSLGGYAVLLAFGDKKFLNLIRGDFPGESNSPYMGVSASLAFFVVAQSLTLVAAVTYDGVRVESALLNFVGCWAFMYSLLLGLAATLRIFFLSRMFDKMPEGTGSGETEKEV